MSAAKRLIDLQYHPERYSTSRAESVELRAGTIADLVLAVSGLGTDAQMEAQHRIRERFTDDISVTT